MKIHDRLYLALSGQSGFGISDPLDCNAYLLDVGDAHILFDAGAGRSIEPLHDMLARNGVSPASVHALFLTHGHADHAGGAAWVKRDLEVQVYAAEPTAKMVSAGDETALSLDRARAAGVYPSDYSFVSCPVDTIVSDGQAIQIGDASITPIATPGHSHDHHSYLIEVDGMRSLISGDALFCDGLVAIQDVYDCSVPDICNTIRTLDQFDFDMLLPGHLRFSLTAGRAHLDMALAEVRKLRCPKSIV